MSKLIDKLKQASQGSPQPMGFGPSRSAPMNPRLILIASLNQANADGLADYVAGADAGLWHISTASQIKPCQQASKTTPDLPWGWWLDSDGEKDVEKLLKLGDDFVVFPIDASLALPQNDKVGRVLQIDSSLNAGFLRAIDTLPVNAVLVKSGRDNRLTWHDLAFFNLLSSLLTKPLLVSTPSTIAADELQSLWEGGVDGLVIEVEVDKPAGKVNELRQLIDGLSYPRSRKRGKLEPLLPQLKSDTSIMSEDEEEE